MSNRALALSIAPASALSRSLVALSLVAIALVIATGSAHAQERRLDLERFRPAPDRDGFLTIPGTRTPGPWNYDVGLFTGYASNQLVVRDLTDGSTVGVVSDRVFGDLYVQLGIAGILAVVIDAPFVLYQAGDGPALDGGAALAAAALRDPRIAGRIRLLGEDATIDRERHEGEGLGIEAGLTVPIGQERVFAGEGAPQLDVTVLGDFHLLDIGVGAMIGIRHRFAEPTVLSVPYRNQLYFGIGVQVPTFFVEHLVVLAELDCTTDLENPFGQAASTVAEWRAGLRYDLRDLSITAQAGTGMVGGVGSPAFRGVLGVTWSPRVHDRDHDGIVDDRDACAPLPEDFDDHEDEDGCPEPDNDHDLVPDLDDACPDEAAELGRDLDDDGCNDPIGDADGDGVLDPNDACPADAEDRDGVSDEDGCADLDDDEDGVPVPADACPGAAEDRDDHEDGDGCPELDDDGDGIVDAQDFCPRQAEDGDAFEPEDGCPEPDDDRDGVLDASDTCPEGAETINGRTDEDGCPDAGRGAWRVTGAPGTEGFGVTARVTFDAAGAPSRATQIDQLAMHLRADWSSGAASTRHVIEVVGTAEQIAGLSAALAARGIEGIDVVPGSVGPTGTVTARRGALDAEGAGRAVVTPMSDLSAARAIPLGTVVGPAPSPAVTSPPPSE